MRHYLFVRMSARPTVDPQDAVDVQPGVLVEAPTFEDAVTQLAAYSHEHLGGSDDPQDYKDDIYAGAIIVCIPDVTRFLPNRSGV